MPHPRRRVSALHGVHARRRNAIGHDRQARCNRRQENDRESEAVPVMRRLASVEPGFVSPSELLASASATSGAGRREVYRGSSLSLSVWNAARATSPIARASHEPRLNVNSSVGSSTTSAAARQPARAARALRR